MCVKVPSNSRRRKSSSASHVSASRLNIGEDRIAAVRVWVPERQLAAPECAGDEGGEREMDGPKVPREDEPALEQDVPVKNRHFRHQGQEVRSMRAVRGAVGVRHWNAYGIALQGGARLLACRRLLAGVWSFYISGDDSRVKRTTL